MQAHVTQAPADDRRLEQLYQQPHTARERHLGLMLRGQDRQPGSGVSALGVDEEANTERAADD